MSSKKKITQENCLNYSWNYAERGGETNHLQVVIPKRQYDYKFKFMGLSYEAPPSLPVTRVF